MDPGDNVRVDLSTSLALWGSYVKGLLAETLMILVQGNSQPASNSLVNNRYQRRVIGPEEEHGSRKTEPWKSWKLALEGLLDINGRC